MPRYQYVNYRQWRAEYVTCSACGSEYGFNAAQPDSDRSCPSQQCRPKTEGLLRRWGRISAAQVGEKEATAVAVHPGTGEVVYCFDRPDAPMPESYAREGFEKKQFHSIHELRSFCKSQGVLNDVVETDSRHDGVWDHHYQQRSRDDRARDERVREHGKEWRRLREAERNRR